MKDLFATDAGRAYETVVHALSTTRVALFDHTVTHDLPVGHTCHGHTHNKMRSYLDAGGVVSRDTEKAIE